MSQKIMFACGTGHTKVRKNLILSENRRAQNITFKCKDNPNADHSLSTRPMQLCRYNSV